MEWAMESLYGITAGYGIIYGYVKHHGSKKMDMHGYI